MIFTNSQAFYQSKVIEFSKNYKYRQNIPNLILFEIPNKVT
jgi:hypothetical protein